MLRIVYIIILLLFCTISGKSNVTYPKVTDRFRQNIADKIDFGAYSVNGVAPFQFNNGKWGVMNINGEVITKCQYDSIIYNCEDSSKYIAVCNDGKYGCINQYGTEIISCQYDSLLVCENVIAHYNRHFGKFGLIDVTGKILFGCKYSNLRVLNGVIACQDEQTSKWCIIDSHGKKLTSYDYDSLSINKLRGSLTKGFVNAWKEGKVGIIRSDGRLIVKCKYEQASCLSINRFYTFKQLQGTKKHKSVIKYESAIIDENGNVISNKYQIFGHEYNGVLPAQNRAGKWGYLDINGREITPFIYDSAGEFRLFCGYPNPLAIAEKNNKKTYVNQDGMELSDTVRCYYYYTDDKYIMYDAYPDYYRHRFAIITPYLHVTDISNKHKEGIVDMCGNVIVPYIFNYVSPIGQGNDIEFFIVGHHRNQLGIYSCTGKLIIPVKYNTISFCGSYFLVELNGKKGYVDVYGNSTL